MNAFDRNKDRNKTGAREGFRALAFQRFTGYLTHDLGEGPRPWQFNHLIYASFASMVWHWLPWLVLAWVWLGVFAVNMRVKELRMARHPGWNEWRGRTWWLVPGLL